MHHKIPSSAVHRTVVPLDYNGARNLYIYMVISEPWEVYHNRGSRREGDSRVDRHVILEIKLTAVKVQYLIFDSNTMCLCC